MDAATPARGSRSLRQQLARGAALFTALVVGVGLVEYESTRLREIRRARELASVAATTLAGRLGAIAARTAAALDILARHASAGAVDCHALLAEVADPSRLYASLTLTDPGGTVLCSSHVPGPPGGGRPPRPPGAAAAQETAIGSPVLDPATGRWVVLFTNARAAGGPRVRLAIDLERLSTLIGEVGGGERMILTITDAEGRVVARSGRSRELLGRPAPFVREMSEAGGSGEAVGFDETRRQFAWRPIAGTGWTVSAGIDQGFVLGSARARSGRTAGALALLLVVFYAGAVVVYRSSIRPFEKLAEGVRAIGEGRDAKPLSVEGPAEVARLIEAFNGALAARRTAEAREVASERRYERIVEAAREGIWFVDDRGRTTFANGFLAGMLGRTREEMIGMGPADLVPPDRRTEIEQRMTGEPAGGAWQVELPFLHRDGSAKWALVSGTPIVETDGRRTGCLAIVTDLTDRRAAEQEVERQRDELRRLSDQLLIAQEQERTRIARELHDELGQMLTALKMDVDAVLRAGDEGARERHGRRVLPLVEDLIDAVQRISGELRPATLDLGLAPALEHELELFGERTGIATSFHEDPGITLPDEVASGLFRIAREALTNVARHARATRVTVEIRSENGATVLVVADDGIGLGASPRRRGSLGIAGMRERAHAIGAGFAIGPAEPRGTRVRVAVPGKEASA